MLIDLLSADGWDSYKGNIAENESHVREALSEIKTITFLLFDQFIFSFIQKTLSFPVQIKE